MDDLQYWMKENGLDEIIFVGFKPCYKWMTFNTKG